MLLKIILGIFMLVVLAAGGAIIKNNVPLLERPGFGQRLLTYLSRNTARTRLDHHWPELRTRRHTLSADALFPRVRQAVKELGWQVAEADAGDRQLHAVVTTPWLRFKDDVRIHLEETADNGTLVHVSSRSRVGRADYGANVGHVMALYGALEASDK